MATARGVHRPDHRGLLTTTAGFRRSRVGTIDAVVVPASRDVAMLGTAAKVASEGRWPLLVLCSQHVSAAAVSDALSGGTASAPVIAVDIDADADLESTRLPVSDHPDAGGDGYADVAAKRNLSLLLGRQLGWSRMLFLDDDIGPLAAASIRRTASCLSEEQGGAAVGWLATGYPDNSVVCHANRRSGGRQRSFIGAGALAVRVDGPVPFFPPVYNEDWLFLFDALVRGAVRLSGDVRQLASDPFASPERARWEEFGDVLGEGLFELLHVRQPVSTAFRPAFWIPVLHARHVLIDTIERRLLTVSTQRARSLDEPARAAMLASLAAARRRLDEITPRSLADFVITWRRDLTLWNDRMARQVPAASIPEALERLGISSAGAMGAGDRLRTA